MNKKTQIYYYTTPTNNNPVKQFLNSLSRQQQTKMLRVFQYIETYGLTIRLPHIKKLTNTPLWEIRILGKHNLKVFYAIPKQNTILMLHGFIKKSQKTPKKELNIAIKRYHEWLDR